MANTQKVYTAIAAVTEDIAKEGIAKDRKNEMQNYKFRGIDDVYNALSPILAKHKLCILPRVLSRELIERKNAKGNPLFFVTVEVEFDFISAEDGSKHTIKMYGEAMDSADKATNKAMSAAYKYAAMQTFCIPTEGDNDADATTHEVAPGSRPAKADPVPTYEPEESAARRARMVEEIDACHDRADLHDWAGKNSAIKQRLTPKDQEIVSKAFADRQKAIKEQPPATELLAAG